MNIGVVLINWNSGDYTQVCLERLFAATRPPDRVALVDNASSDGSPARLAAAWPDIDHLPQTVNTGFAGGNNLGIAQLLDAGCDAIWILNNDTEVAPDCLALMEAALKADPTVGVATGKMLYPQQDGESAARLWYAGGRISPWTFEATHERQGALDEPAGEAADDTGFVCGCSMLVRRELLERLGGFDNRFFAYCEDVDWSLRALAAGVRLRYLPDAILTHHVSVSTTRNTLGDAGGRISPAAHYLLARNRRFVIRRHARGLAGATATLRYWARQGWFWFGLKLRGRSSKLQAMRLGMQHGADTALEEQVGLEASAEFGIPEFE